MSKKLRNVLSIGLASSLVIGTSLTLLADTTPTSDSQNTTASPEVTNTVVTSNQPLQSTSTNAKGYIPPNHKNETIYVNMDYYGIPTETQVVNGYRIDGQSQIVDYGNYSNITNLTNYAKPTIDGDQITWNLDEDVTNFYYQGTLSEIELPWHFTIRYKLNGVETKAEELAGASGMIETIIDVTPNENVSDYLKNNFFLQLSTSYDMGKCLSVEAPDGVDVTLGATKSITFMAMPGEEASFHVYVGSNSYESTGFNVVIAPLEMSALDEVTDLKDAKGRMENAFDAASESLDIILDSTSDIQGGLSELNTGISSIQSSLKSLRQDDAALDEKVEQLLQNATTFNESLQTLTPHLDSATNCASELNENGNVLVTHLNSLSPLLEETKTALQVLQADCTDLKDIVEKLTSTGNKLDGNLGPLKACLLELGKDMASLDTTLGNLNSGLDSSQGSLSSVSNSVSDLSSLLNSISGSMSDEQMQGLINGAVQNGVSPEQLGLLQNLTSMSDDLSRLSSLLNTTGSLADDSADVISTLQEVSKDVASLSVVLINITDNLQDVTTTLTNHSDTFIFTLDDISMLLDNLSQATDIGVCLITDIDHTQNIINKYHPELVSLFEDMRTLTTDTSNVTIAATDLGTQVHSTITNNRQHTYDSIDKTLSGSMHTFDRIIDSLNQTNDLKKNKDIIKNTIDEEWDKLDDDFNLLDYEPEAGPISLVSEKNTNIDSIQIILRTPEISIDKKAEIKALEEDEAQLSIWDRIKNIFSNLLR